MIKAPFNFVPLPDQIVFPGWGDQVSQDIPFRDGVSGVIELDITAKTDIFVRNGHKLEDEEKNFSQVNGSYFIPGTTLKGCFRSVLEILSFGKIKQFNKHSFSIRDLNSPKYKKLLQKNETHGGWMYQHGGGFYLFDIGKIGAENRITMAAIDNAIHNACRVFTNFVSGSIKNRNARYKYELLAGALKNLDAEQRKRYKNGESFLEVDEKYVVFTGQPNQGKRKEFLFRKPLDNCNPSLCIQIPDEDMETFQSIHESSSDYSEFWKKNLEKGKPIPVFFQTVADDDGQTHYYIGLSYMFKYPAKYNVEKVIKKYYERVTKSDVPEGLDMADLIFGYQQGERSMRGRVMVGNAFVNKLSGLGNEQRVIMSSPRSSYHPLYLKYDKYPVTWDNGFEKQGGRIEIAGYKRYPIRKEVTRIESNMTNGKMVSSMIPLKQGTTFKGKIIFHNLRPVELGALLYAVILSESNGKNGTAYCHNIGACKPYGYGKVFVQCKLKQVDQDITQEGCLKAFKDYMEKQCQNQWEKSSTVMELQKMVAGIPRGKEDLFAYMELSQHNPKDPKKSNEFVEGKKNYQKKGERLGLFSQIIGEGACSKGIPVFSETSQNASPNRRDDKGIDSIQQEERKKGWRLEVGEDYKGIITDRKLLQIYCPGERNQQKNLCCRFSVDGFKTAQPNSYVEFELVEKCDDGTVVIRIEKCERKNRWNGR